MRSPNCTPTGSPLTTANPTACTLNGILFNHESPRRGETFVTRKITRAIANIAQGLESCLYLGNMDSLRDWGHAKDDVKMQWMMLQQEQPEDLVIATGVQYSVRQFVEMAAAQLASNCALKARALKRRALWFPSPGMTRRALNRAM